MDSLTPRVRACLVTDCERKYAAKGYCHLHWARWRKHGDPLITFKGKYHKAQTTDDGRRICKRCSEPKPASEFHKDSGSPDGLRAQCKPCRSAFMKGYYEETADDRRAAMKQHRLDNPEHVRAIDTARYRRDRDKRIAQATEQTHIRRARMLSRQVDKGITFKTLRDRDGDDCCYCGTPMTFDASSPARSTPNRATLEHVLPISRGGAHTWDNVALACVLCNLQKNAKTLDEWVPEWLGTPTARPDSQATGRLCANRSSNEQADDANGKHLKAVA